MTYFLSVLYTVLIDADVQQPATATQLHPWKPISINTPTTTILTPSETVIPMFVVVITTSISVGILVVIIILALLASASVIVMKNRRSSLVQKNKVYIAILSVYNLLVYHIKHIIMLLTLYKHSLKEKQLSTIRDCKFSNHEYIHT